MVASPPTGAPSVHQERLAEFEQRAEEEPNTSLRLWRVKLGLLAERYEAVDRELRSSDLDVFPREATDVAVWAAYELPTLSREVDEVREDPDVVAAVEKIRGARESVERILNQKFAPLRDDQLREIALFSAAASSLEDERLSGEGRANAS